MKCQLESFFVSSDGRAFGASHAVTMCRTHNWALGQLPVTVDTQCPIGQIEDAVDAAIKRIEEATSRR
jgi:hypothetical protein